MEARPNDATVAELLAMVRGMLDDERTRGQGLDGKSATLAGFTGTILALTATLGAELLDLDLGSRRLGASSSASTSSRWSRSASAALVALIGVLRPQPRLALAMDEIRRFSEFPLIAQPTVEVRAGDRHLIEALAHERGYARRALRAARRPRPHRRPPAARRSRSALSAASPPAGLAPVDRATVAPCRAAPGGSRAARSRRRVGAPATSGTRHPSALVHALAACAASSCTRAWPDPQRVVRARHRPLATPGATSAPRARPLPPG